MPNAVQNAFFFLLVNFYLIFFYFSRIKIFSLIKILFLFFSHFVIVVQVQLSPLSPHNSPPHPSHPHFPPLILLPFDFVQGSFIHVPENPSTLSFYYPLPPPLWLLSVCSEFHWLWFYFADLFVCLLT